MRPSITSLHQSTQETLDFLILAAELDTFRRSSESLNSTLRPLLASSSWRRQVYSLAIILLYGAHERFICDLCIQVAQMYRRLYSRYDDLPIAVRNAHFELTTGKLTKLDDITRASYISRLHACLQGAVDLNLDVFAHHTANFRSSVITDNLSKLGISFFSSAVHQQLNADIKEGRLAGIYATAENVVDDLANRRNDIAHGNDVDVLELQTVAAIAACVYRYDVEMASFVGNFLLHDLVTRNGVLIGQVNKVWKNASSGIRSLAGITEVRTAVETQTPCWVSNGNGSVTHCIIRRIEKDKIEMDRVSAGTQEVCFDVGVKIAESNSMHTLHGFWSAPSAELLSVMNERCETNVVAVLGRLSS